MSAILLVGGLLLLQVGTAGGEQVRAGAQPIHRLFIQEHTGHWGCSPHGGFYREIDWFAIQLPEEPKGQARYEAKDLLASTESGSINRKIELTGGYVEVNLTVGKLTIALETPGGKLWAIGAYPLRKRSL